MNLTTDELPLDCTCGCTETEDRNVYTENINGIDVPVEWSVHCKSCGMYFGRFVYGHWEF